MLLSSTSLKAQGINVLFRCQREEISLSKRCAVLAFGAFFGVFFCFVVWFFFFQNHTFKQFYPGDICTCAKRTIAVPTKLCHNSNTIGSCLPNLRAVVTYRLEHRPQEVFGVLEWGGAAVLYNVIKNAQPPLPVWPWPVRTLQQKQETFKPP